MKMGFFAIYRQFADTFIVASFHELYPGFAFWKKPSYLSTVIVHLTYIRVAYGRFSGELKEALANKSLSKSQKNYLHNLRSLCEFYIPVVSSHTQNTW